MTTPLYTVQSAAKRYRVKGRDIAALGPIDLQVDKGDFLVVSGASGSGKSTLLMLLGGLLQPTSGRILFENEDLYKMDPRRRADVRARRIGFVFQTFHLIPYLNALDNILVSALAQTSADRRALRQRARSLLDTFGLDDRRTHRPAELSVGQRQRVAMARALLLSPDILLADEPTGNLDDLAATQLIASLTDFHKQGGTVVLVTHSANMARCGTRNVRIEKS